MKKTFNYQFYATKDAFNKKDVEFDYELGEYKGNTSCQLKYNGKLVGFMFAKDVDEIKDYTIVRMSGNISPSSRETLLQVEVEMTEEQLKNMVSRFECKLTGVTFGDRQKNLEKEVNKKGQSFEVQLHKDYFKGDPCVAVRTLDGKELGYVPAVEVEVHKIYDYKIKQAILSVGNTVLEDSGKEVWFGRLVIYYKEEKETQTKDETPQPQQNSTDWDEFLDSF